MKKIIIAACMALLGCGSVFAQQGKQAIGGNLSYGTDGRAHLHVTPCAADAR